MRKFFNFMMVLFVTAMCVSFSSCSDNDDILDENISVVSGEENILGTWRQTWDDGKNYSINDITFNKDHTFLFREYGKTEAGWENGEVFAGTWSYDVEERKITLISFNGDAPDIEYQETAIINKDFKTFIYYDDEGEDMCRGGEFPFIKLSDAPNSEDKVIGTWKPLWDNGDYYIVTFNKNHTYKSVGYNKSGNADEIVEGTWQYSSASRRIYSTPYDDELKNVESYLVLTPDFKQMWSFYEYESDGEWHCDEMMLIKID